MNNHLLPFPYKQSKPASWLTQFAWSLVELLPRAPNNRFPEAPSSAPTVLGDSEQSSTPITVICISDTHNITCALPPGDILIHAGDLTAHGTFQEIQDQLSWISSQPHKHKVMIAGNHDILLDEACDAKFVTRSGDSAEERGRLDWGDIHYLQNEAITLEFKFPSPGSGSETEIRKVNIYGSPSTPERGTWAFQYPAIRDVWTGRVPADTDILVVHGPPALYGDYDGDKDAVEKGQVKGDGYLLREIRRSKPKLVVCGHIHGAFGTTVIRHDGIQDVADGLHMRWEGYGLIDRLRQSIPSSLHGRARAGAARSETLVVNAAIAPSDSKRDTNKPVAVEFD